MKAPQVTGWRAAGSWALMLALGAVGAGCEQAGPAVDAESDAGALARTSQEANSPLASSFPSTYARQWMTNQSNSVRWLGRPSPMRPACATNVRSALRCRAL